MVLVVIKCGICEAAAGVGMDANNAVHNVIDSGGRTFGNELTICSSCARHTR